MASVYDLKDEVTGEVCILPTWFKKKEVTEAGCQTDAVAALEGGTQTAVSSLAITNQLEQGVGTEEESIPRAVMEGMQFVYPGSHFDAPKVTAFLEKSQKALIEILQRNTKSSAFDRYQPVWSDRSNKVHVAHTLTSPLAVEKELHALALSWNSLGSVIAVGYGRIDSAGWCTCSSHICLWSINRRDFDEHLPHQTLLVDSYVTSLAFHPQMSSVLAAGTYSGEILLWTQAMDENPAPPLSTLPSGVNPKEPVTQLQWVQHPLEQRDDHRYLLCAASQDGLVMFWSLSNKLSAPIALFHVQTRRQHAVGVVSMSYTCSSSTGGRGGVPVVDNLLLLGLENGEVSRARPGLISSATPMPTGVTRVLDLERSESHQGPVHSVDASPFFRNLFLTASSDGSVRLHSTLERAPLLSLEPSIESKHYLYGAQFSPFRPSVIAVVSRSSFLHLYDLQKSRSKPCCSLEAGVDGAPVLSVEFNTASPDWLATGDMRSFVRLWRICSELAHSTDVERAAVRYSELHSNGPRGSQVQLAESDSPTKEVKDNDSNPVKQLFGFAL